MKGTMFFCTTRVLSSVTDYVAYQRSI